MPVPVLLKIAAILLAGSGVFLLASGIQIPTVNGAGRAVAFLNWAGQRCGVGSVCIHPEWIAAGAVLLFIASLLLLRSRGKGDQS
jgi:hypothetical protein